MRISPFFHTILAIFLLIGGTIGFVKSHSLISLIMGWILGLSLLWCSYKSLKSSILHNNTARFITLITVIVFAIRWSKTHSFFPAGIMLCISLGVLIITNITEYFRKHNN